MMIATTTRAMINAMLVYRSIGATQPLWLKNAGTPISPTKPLRDKTMTGRTRLPGGEPRKASQRRTRRGEAPTSRIAPQWRFGDRIEWQKKVGTFHRDLGDGNAEVTIANRAYRVRIGDLRPG